MHSIMVDAETVKQQDEGFTPQVFQHKHHLSPAPEQIVFASFKYDFETSEVLTVSEFDTIELGENETIKQSIHVALNDQIMSVADYFGQRDGSKVSLEDVTYIAGVTTQNHQVFHTLKQEVIMKFKRYGKPGEYFDIDGDLQQD